MKLEICKRWDILISENNPKIWEIELDDILCRKWYNEVIRRFKEMPDKITKQYFKKYPVYDIDEAYGCWQISLEHLKDMLTFLTNN